MKAVNRIFPHLTTATALPGYRLALKFENGIEGVVDLSEWKGKGVFECWNDEENFRSFKITKRKKLEWTEAIDMDPDAFYLQIIGKTFEEYARDKQVLRYTH